jgi:hypothetical protein
MKRKMKVMKAALVLLVCGAMLALQAPAGAACRDIQGGLSNFDVFNRTGLTANDFEVILLGVSATDLGSLYTGDYPNATVTTVAGGVKIRWTGDTTLNGTWSHFGIGLKGNLNPTSTEFSWTFNGGALPVPPPRQWQDWNMVNGNTVARDVIRNQGPDPFRVQRRILTLPGPNVVELNELLRGGALWNQALLIDTTPVEILGGANLNWDFPVTDDINYMMMYDMFDSQTGERMMTFLNAVQVCPEPGVLSAVACCLGTALLRRRK